MTPQENKDRRAILTLAYSDHKKALNSHAFFKVNDREMGEDLVQDTFMKTWKYLVKGGKIATMKAFLYHILNNLIIDEYRKHKTSSLDVLLEKGFEPSLDDSERLVDFLDGKVTFLLIARLPVMYQKIMRMKYLQDLTLTEMSLLTGKSKNSIAVQVSRGTKKLKALFDQAS